MVQLKIIYELVFHQPVVWAYSFEVSLSHENTNISRTLQKYQRLTLVTSNSLYPYDFKTSKGFIQSIVVTILLSWNFWSQHSSQPQEQPCPENWTSHSWAAILARTTMMWTSRFTWFHCLICISLLFLSIFSWNLYSLPPGLLFSGRG